jgi:hypothetical protein
MPEQYADILMTLSSTYHCLGQPAQALPFASAHFNQRILIEDGKSSTERDDAFRAMAYTELSLARVMNGEYEEGIHLAVQGRILLEDTPEFKEGVYWPHWADFHHAWGLIGLGRAEEARGIIEVCRIAAPGPSRCLGRERHLIGYIWKYPIMEADVYP